MKKSIILIVSALLLPALLAACGLLVAGGAGAGAAYVYERGWLERQYDISLNEANQAVEQAAQELNMTIDERKDQVGGSEFKLTKGEENTWIRTEARGEKSTQISVRTGYMGDQEASRTVHRELESKIG